MLRKEWLKLFGNFQMKPSPVWLQSAQDFHTAISRYLESIEGQDTTPDWMREAGWLERFVSTKVGPKALISLPPYEENPGRRVYIAMGGEPAINSNFEHPALAGITFNFDPWVDCEQDSGASTAEAVQAFVDHLSAILPEESLR